MSITTINLPQESDPTRFAHAGNGRLINGYWEPTPNGKSGGVIVSCDGLDPFATLAGDGGVRAVFPFSDADLLVVAGRLLFRCDVAGSHTLIGGIPSDGLVTMGRNRVGQVGIVCDGLYFKYESGTLIQLEDPDLPPPTSIAAGNGYFIFQLADGRMFSSDLDSVDVVPVDFATADTNPDPGVRIINRSPDFISFGTRSYEVWRDAGNPEFPLDRVTSRNVGLLAAGAVCEVDQTVAFVAHDCSVRLLNGYDANVISTAPVVRTIEDEASKAGIVGYQYASRGHRFLSLSGTNWTWEYNLTTGKWHERESYGLGRFRGAQSGLFGNRWIIGDYADPKLYVCNPLSVGATAMTDQIAMVDYSDDGGLNFASETMHSVGAIGQRQKRVRRYRLGMTESRVYRLRIDATTDAGEHSVMTVQTAPVHTFPVRDQHRGIRWDVVPGLGPQANERGVVACALMHGAQSAEDRLF